MTSTVGVPLVPPPPPPAAPLAPLVPPPVVAQRVAPTVVAMDACKISCRELYRIGAKGLFNGLVFKLMRSHQNGITGCPTVAELAPCRVEQPTIPEAASPAFVKFMELFKTAGFLDPVWYEVQDDFNAARFYTAVFAHPCGEHFAQVTCRIWQQTQPARQSFITAIVSKLQAGGFALTAAEKVDLDQPANYRARYVGENVTVPDLLQRHTAHIAELKAKPRPIIGAEEVAQAAEEFHRGLARHYLARGIFRPLTASEKTLMKNSRITGEHAEHGDVLLEMNRQSSKRTHPVVALLLFVVSVAAFIHFQQATMSLHMVGLLVGVVFFHELGHFLAMKIFKYRDVRMFFIPFFGAAVVGRKIGAPGWQQAIVSLAGPLPGIAVGVGLGIAGLMLHRPYYPEVSKMLLIINVLNLLPILPLDGGRFLQAVIFSRSPIMDVFFRGLGAAACIAFGLYLGDKIILAVGISFAISLSITYRVARIASELKDSGGLPGHIESSASTPPQAAGVIIARLREAFKANQNRRTLAAFATQVYERVSAAPPSALASVALVVLYLGSGLVGLGFGVYLLVGSPTNFRQLARAAQSQPSHTVTSKQIQSWDGPASCAKHQHLTIAATFGNAADAQRTFNALQAELPATAAARLFGDSVFVMLPPGNNDLRKEWFGKLDVQTKGVFVLQPQEPCTFKLQLIAPSAEASDETAETLNSYFSVARFRAIAPWDPADLRDDATRARNDAARRTYSKLIAVDFDELADTDNREIMAKITTARREGDKAETARLQKVMSDAAEQRRSAHIADIRKLPDANAEVIDAFVESQAESQRAIIHDDDDEADEHLYRGAQKKFETRLTALIGQQPQRSWSAGCQFGTAKSHGVLVDIPYCSTTDVANTLPAMTQWLSQRGLSGKYELTGSFGLHSENP